jgi:ferredoxin
MKHYHEESFGETPVIAEEQAIEQAEIALEEAEALDISDMHEVAFAESGRSIKIAPGETIHAAATRLGLHIPKACGMGICGTCRVRLNSGKVSMEHNGGITDDELEAGDILSCCSIPIEDVSVEF